MLINLKKYQIILNDYLCFGFKKLKIKETAMALVYDWILIIGFVEVRRFQNKKKLGKLIKIYNEI